LFTGLIFTLSSIPELATPQDLGPGDKVAHVAEYFIWGLFLRRALDRVVRAPGGFNAAVALLTGACLAYLDESFQRTVGRQYSTWDMTADVAGVVLAQVATDAKIRRERSGGGA
jgi:VanZ family protein